MVLLEAHYHVAHQGTLAWQERPACLQGHRMPHLTVFEAVIFSCIAIIWLFDPTLLRFGSFTSIELFGKEAKFGAYAEVRDREKNDFLEHRVSRQLMTVIHVEVQLFQTHWQ